MSAIYTIRKIYVWHKEQFPDSQISERMVRQAVINGQLPSISSGNRKYISTENFERWLNGELQTV